MPGTRPTPSRLSLLASLLVTLTALPAVAAPATAPRFQLSVAGNLSTLDTQASMGPPGGGSGAVVVFEEVFDLPVHDGFLEVQASWKYAGRNYVDAGFLDLERTNQRIIDRDVQFGGYTFHTGAEVEASFDSRFVYLAYRRDLLQMDPIRISASAGITQTIISTGLTGSGAITDQDGQAVTGTRTSEAKVKLPVPMLGFQLEWDLAERDRLLSYHRFIGFETSDIRGAMLQSALRYHHFFTPQVGFGAGFEATNVELPRYVTEDYTARFSYSIVGLTLYVQTAF